MKKTALIVMALLLGTFIGTSFAVEVTLFGPNQYTRTTGKPNVYADTFPGISGQGKLVLKNGTQDGKNRVSSALITINGKQVLSPKDFNQKVYEIDVPINLAENNSISVELRSNPGSYLAIMVTEDVEGEAATKLTTLVFSDALERGNTTKALDFVLESAKEKFEEIFMNLGNGGVRELGETLKNATPVFVGETYAEYQGIVTFPNGDRVIGKFSLIKTSIGWRFTQI